MFDTFERLTELTEFILLQYKHSSYVGVIPVVDKEDASLRLIN